MGHWENMGTFALSGDSSWSEIHYDHLTTPFLRNGSVVTVVLFRIFWGVSSASEKNQVGECV